MKAEIPAPEFPDVISHVWHWFKEIVRGVDGNGWSFPVVSWNAIDCWQRLTGEIVAPHEVRTIMTLGVLRANILNESLKKPDGGKA